jgi:hypothetical protein
MSAVSAEEVKRRQSTVRSVLGTHAMEGLFPDETTLEIMRRYEIGELSLDQFSAAMDAHAHSLIAGRRSLVGAA